MKAAYPSSGSSPRAAFPRLGMLLLTACILGLAASSGAAVPQEILDTLLRARQTLAISEASQRSIELELERLRASETTPAETVEQYEDYLSRVSQMVERQREIVRRMEELAGAVPPPPAVEPLEMDPDLVPSLPQAADEVAVLEQSFEDSLAAFDAALMSKLDELARELEELNDAAADEAGSLASAIEAARQRLEGGGAGGQGGSGEEADAGNEASREGRGPSEGETDDADREQHGEETAAASDESPDLDPGEAASAEASATDRTGGTASMGSANSTSSGPVDFRDDDDIIARQLREAAEKETDPVLKERLWDEYNRYKQSGSL